MISFINYICHIGIWPGICGLLDCCSAHCDSPKAGDQQATVLPGTVRIRFDDPADVFQAVSFVERQETLHLYPWATMHSARSLAGDKRTRILSFIGYPARAQCIRNITCLLPMHTIRQVRCRRMLLPGVCCNSNCQPAAATVMYICTAASLKPTGRAYLSAVSGVT